MFEKNSTVRASIHCGSIQLDVFLANGLDKIIRCNCSMCSRDKGFGMICSSGGRAGHQWNGVHDRIYL